MMDSFDMVITGKDVEIARLKDRISNLEKLTALQKETIDAQGEALQETNLIKIELANLKDTLNPDRRSCLTCENTECDVLIGADQTCWRPAQKAPEPELFICPNYGIKPACANCSHNHPHKHTDNCDDHFMCKSPRCDICEGKECKCIPYKKEPTVPQPEETKSPIQHLQDRVLELEQHQGRDRADFMEKIREIDEKFEELKGQYGGYDFGNRVTGLERENKDLKTEYHIINDVLEDLGKQLKSLKEDSGAELSQLAKDTNRALYEHKQINDTAREVSNEQAVAIYKMQEQIAEIQNNPLLRTYSPRPNTFTIKGSVSGTSTGSGPTPSIEKKPKSRLKCDRAATKRVK